MGELLLDADLHARLALWDPNPDEAAARVRTWGEVIEAAAAVWAAIPDRDNDPTMAQLHARAARPNPRWPGGGEGDPTLTTVAASLMRAADLVSARRHPTAELSEAGHLDAEAARTRLMHTVYVASHAVALSLDHHVRDLRRRLEAGRAVPAGESLTHARTARERATAAERLAGLYLETRWPAALAGQHQPSPDTSRLQTAVARWDVAAHRALTRSPTIADLSAVAQVQAQLALATSTLTAAAAHAALVDGESFAQRLAPSLVEAERAWAHLGADLRQLTGRDRRRNPELLLSANELTASLREYTHDQSGQARPSAVAQDEALWEVTRTLRGAAAAAPDIAQTVREVLVEAELSASATSIHALVAAHLGRDLQEAWVNPADLAHHRQVPLSQAARGALAETAERAVHAVRAVDVAAGTLHPAGTVGASARSVDPVATGWRRHERESPGRDAAGPGVGCER
ncbi:hypothetical protein KMZ30_19510 [Phycicoccus sp. KQZ13P-1]|uniref:hypothetical protein n=1 Tax=Phycicoccus mangrovi TaxID=2840470 RepID=UPI001C009011|nr:hypothetical protein [Phycicoccus mangrovi]MBT9257762.1 hypothetical protein [Phycicoccus mangrovi]